MENDRVAEYRHRPDLLSDGEVLSLLNYLNDRPTMSAIALTVRERAWIDAQMEVMMEGA